MPDGVTMLPGISSRTTCCSTRMGTSSCPTSASARRATQRSSTQRATRRVAYNVLYTTCGCCNVCSNSTAPESATPSQLIHKHARARARAHPCVISTRCYPSFAMIRTSDADGYNCTGTGPTPAHTSAGTGPCLPHLHQDWVRPAHICTGTRLAPRLRRSPPTRRARRSSHSGTRPCSRRPHQRTAVRQVRRRACATCNKQRVNKQRATSNVSTCSVQRVKCSLQQA